MVVLQFLYTDYQVVSKGAYFRDSDILMAVCLTGVSFR